MKNTAKYYFDLENGKNWSKKKTYQEIGFNEWKQNVTKTFSHIRVKTSYVQKLWRL